MKLTEAIAIRVQELLDINNITAYMLFKKGGIPRSTTSDILNVKKQKVSTDYVYNVCATLNISLKEFFDSEIFNNLDD